MDTPSETSILWTLIISSALTRNGCLGNKISTIMTKIFPKATPPKISENWWKNRLSLFPGVHLWDFLFFMALGMTQCSWGRNMDTFFHTYHQWWIVGTGKTLNLPLSMILRRGYGFGEESVLLGRLLGKQKLAFHWQSACLWQVETLPQEIF